MKTHILIVEDDVNTRVMLAYRLEYAGYHVTQAPDGETALRLLEEHTYNVVLTDIVLGNIDGMDVMHAARRQPYSPEVVLLTGHGSLETSITALRTGAYDYLLKPCTSEQLLKSIAGAIKRHTAETALRDAATTVLANLQGRNTHRETPAGEPQPPQPHAPESQPVLAGTVQIGALTVGTSRYDVRFQGQPVRLTPTEYALLRYLAERSGQLCSCQDIVRSTHGLTVDEAEAQAMVRSHIRNVRKKLDAAYLVNERGSGYMLVAPPPPTHTK